MWRIQKLHEMRFSLMMSNADMNNLWTDLLSFQISHIVYETTLSAHFRPINCQAERNFLLEEVEKGKIFVARLCAGDEIQTEEAEKV
jgi:hypothetical protein